MLWIKPGNNRSIQFKETLSIKEAPPFRLIMQKWWWTDMKSTRDTHALKMFHKCLFYEQFTQCFCILWSKNTTIRKDPNCHACVCACVHMCAPVHELDQLSEDSIAFLSHHEEKVTSWRESSEKLWVPLGSWMCVCVRSCAHGSVWVSEWMNGCHISYGRQCCGRSGVFCSCWDKPVRVKPLVLRREKRERL